MHKVWITFVCLKLGYLCNMYVDIDRNAIFKCVLTCVVFIWKYMVSLNFVMHL